MNLPTKRGYARKYLEAPIKFVLGTADVQHDGVMRNCSVGGMHFVTSFQLRPGAPLDIHLKTIEGQRGAPVVAPGTIRSRVAWCEPLAIEPSQYGVGVMFDQAVSRKKRLSEGD